MLKSSRLVYPLVNAGHILSIGALFGSILALDIRLMGFFGAVALPPLARFLPLVAAAGLSGAVVTGFLLFMVQPIDYAANPAFLVKLGLVALGALHAAFVHAGRRWRRMLDTGVASAGLRASAALSVAIWVGAIVAGRFIAFMV
nr:DUF2214 domain-containing protein [Aurantimonas sp. VKM B-3413]